MIKILLLAIAFWIILRILRGYRTNLDNTKNTAPENMVRCAECGVHHPISDSFLVKGKHVCCLAHSKKTKF